MSRRQLVVIGLLWFYAPQIDAQGLLPELRALRQEYPTPMSQGQVGELLTRTAQSTPGWGLLQKLTGNRCPAMGTFVSCDFLVRQSDYAGFDVLIDVEGAAIPTWPPSPSDRFDASQFVPVVGQLPGPSPVPVPPVGGDADRILSAVNNRADGLAVDHSRILARLDQLEIGAGAAHDSLRAQIAEVRYPDPGSPPDRQSQGLSAATVWKWIGATAGTAVATCLSTKCWRGSAEP